MRSKGTEFAVFKLPRFLLGEWSKVALAQNDDLGSLIERNPPPRGGFLFTMFPDRTGSNKQCGTKDLRACWQLRPRPAPGLLTLGSPLPPRSSLVCFCAALNVFKSRAHLRDSTGSVGVGPTTALLPSPALPEIIVRPSDARPAIVASRFTGVLLCCALCLHISCTLAEPYGVCRCSKNDHAARCSRAPDNCRCVHSICSRRLASPSPAWL